MEFKEKTISSTTVYDGKVIKVCRDDVILPNGDFAVRDMVHHSGGSAVVCERDGKILMVKQFRYAFKKELWEIPAGKLNVGEDPALTAIRELEEEGGIKAGRVQKICEIYPTPAYNNEITHIYRAYDLTQTKVKLDEGEFLTCEWIEIEKLKAMILNGEIKDAKTVVGILAVINGENS